MSKQSLGVVEDPARPSGEAGNSLPGGRDGELGVPDPDLSQKPDVDHSDDTSISSEIDGSS